MITHIVALAVMIAVAIIVIKVNVILFINFVFVVTRLRDRSSFGSTTCSTSRNVTRGRSRVITCTPVMLETLADLAYHPLL